MCFHYRYNFQRFYSDKENLVRENKTEYFWIFKRTLDISWFIKLFFNFSLLSIVSSSESMCLYLKEGVYYEIRWACWIEIICFFWTTAEFLYSERTEDRYWVRLVRLYVSGRGKTFLGCPRSSWGPCGTNPFWIKLGWLRKEWPWLKWYGLNVSCWK